MTRTALVGWFIVSTAICADLLAGHLITLPGPEDSALSRATSRLRAHGDRGRWLSVHILYSGCRCSQRIFDQLLESERSPEVGELILLAGDDPVREKRAIERGLRVVHVTEEQLADEYEIDAAPLLVVADHRGRVRYSGGYTDRKQGRDVKDRAIVAALRRGEEVQPLPIFGCAVSKKLRKTLDPLGLK